MIHDIEKLSSVKDLTLDTYMPNGGTALLDALGATIESVGAKLAALTEDERPSKVLFLVITDGDENASRKFTKTKIKEMVEHQTSIYNWEFVFMGANIDSMSEGSAMGVSRGNAMNYVASANGTNELYKSLSHNTTKYRTSGGTGKKDPFFDPAAAPLKPEVK
jgi:uncharacterized protein YegL